MFWVSREPAAAAVRQYGDNVDSGALEYAAVIVFLLPLTALFGLAAVAGARDWRLARYVHRLAVVAAACPMAYGAIATGPRSLRPLMAPVTRQLIACPPGSPPGWMDSRKPQWQVKSSPVAAGLQRASECGR